MDLQQQRIRTKITLGQGGNALLYLVAVCLVLFVGLAFLMAVWYFRFPKETAVAYFRQDVLSWFVMPAGGKALLARPWTLLTHMFVHDGFWQLFSNMLWLWAFGYILQDMTGNRKLVPVFIYGALTGAVAFYLALHLVPSLRPLLPVAFLAGASAGVMAVAVATTLVAPGYRIFPLIGGGLPLWVLTLVYVMSDLLTTSVSDTAGLIHHLGGALAGFGFVFFLRRGFDASEWMANFFDWVNNLFNPDKPARNRNIRDELFYESDKAPFQRTPHVTQDRIDAILDKINQQGYHFLTEEENDLLKRAGEEQE